MASKMPTADFEYVSYLGHGAFGVVLKVIDSTTDSHSAVKIIFPEDDHKDLKYIQRECKILNSKNHINVVKVLNFFETNFTNANGLKEIAKLLVDNKILEQFDIYKGRLKRNKILPAIFIEMELCGSTLRKWLDQHVDHDKNNLEFQSTQVTIIQNMISGMEFLHENKIMHRDFKPDNVMFSIPKEDDQFPFPLKIGDFGISRILHSEKNRTSTLTSKTLTYMAPEMDGNSYNFLSDIFSLGLVIWEVAQLIPFRDRKKMFTDLVMFEKTELVVSFSTKISSMIVSMTKKHLEERMKSMFEVNRLFESILKVPAIKRSITSTSTKMGAPAGRMSSLVVENLQEIVHVLLNDGTMHTSWKQIAYGTGLNQTKIHTINRNYITTIYTLDDVLTDILTEWAGGAGNNATVSDFCTILKSKGLNFCHDKIKAKFSTT